MTKKVLAKLKKELPGMAAWLPKDMSQRGQIEAYIRIGLLVKPKKKKVKQ